ncbi:MAG: hypothetical protein AAFQ01_03195, partial [Bacteroidota bacterium]
MFCINNISNKIVFLLPYFCIIGCNTEDDSSIKFGDDSQSSEVVYIESGESVMELNKISYRALPDSGFSGDGESVDYSPCDFMVNLDSLAIIQFRSSEFDVMGAGSQCEGPFSDNVSIYRVDVRAVVTGESLPEEIDMVNFGLFPVHQSPQE